MKKWDVGALAKWSIEVLDSLPGKTTRNQFHPSLPMRRIWVRFAKRPFELATPSWDAPRGRTVAAWFPHAASAADAPIGSGRDRTAVPARFRSAESCPMSRRTEGRRLTTAPGRYYSTLRTFLGTSRDRQQSFRRDKPRPPDNGGISRGSLSLP